MIAHPAPVDILIPPVPIDRIQIVKLDKDYRSGTVLDPIIDPDNLDGVASGAIFGSSLYVNNARYSIGAPQPESLTKLKIRSRT